jgi:hypothetical protein
MRERSQPSRVAATWRAKRHVLAEPSSRLWRFWNLVSRENGDIWIRLSILTWKRGWATVKETLTYPSSSAFHKVTGLTNRPLTIEEAYLPQDERLQLISGVDLTQQVERVVEDMKAKVPEVDTVTHVVFTAYIQKMDPIELRDVNVALLKTGITAIETLAPNLQAVILQTGGKSYGLEYANEVEIVPPLKESLPRLPEPCTYQMVRLLRLN